MGAKRRWGRRFCRIQSDCIERSVLSLEPLEPRVLLSLSYTITDLGTPGGTFAAAVDINNDGQVTGYGYTAANTSESMRAFLWQNGALTVVPNFSLGGLTSVYGYAINENGVIAAATDFTTTPERASYYQGTTFSNIQNIASSYASTARGLNDATNPTVVGWYYDPNNSSQTYPFSWSVSTGMVTLAGSTGKAQDVNNSNQIVGSSMINGYPRAVLWQGGTMTNLDPTNNFDSAAIAINDNGQVAGWTRLVSKYHAFIWDDQTGIKDLGTLWDSDYGFSDSRDINNSGQVVGVSDIDPWDGEPADTYRAFIYDDGEMIRLETRVTNLGSWTLLAAEGINDNGQVVGWGRLNGNIRAFILNPVDSESPTAEAAAENVSMASGAPYQFSVIYSDNVAVDVSTLGSNDITVTGPGGFSQTATLVSVSDSSDGTPRTAIYRITPPGGTWDQADNGIYSIVLAANQVGDTSNNFAAAGELDSFAVDIKLKPLANLSYPAHSQTLPLTQINASQRYIDVAYMDRSGTGLNTQTIVDTGAEFSLTGSAAANVIVNGSPSLVAGTPATYRYSFTGDFGIGVVQVAFIAGAWSDKAGGVNDAETEQFELVMTDTQGPRVIHLEPDTLAMAGLTEIEVTFSEAISASSITKEDIKLWDPEGGVIVVDGVEKLANDSYKIKFTAQDKVGDYSVQIGPDIKDMFGNKMNQDSDGINGETPGGYLYRQVHRSVVGADDI